MNPLARAAALLAGVAISLYSGEIQPSSGAGLAVHEWGTFTSVAGSDGRAVEWLPLSGADDLPCFVTRLGSYGFKIGLWGTMRMETPVIYFYSQRPITVSAAVDFPGGLITEWYPQASRVEPGQVAGDGALRAPGVRGHIEWASVSVRPGLDPGFAVEPGPSHYYAARQTDAAPVHAGGTDEKFLFYRGVGNFPAPVSVRTTEDDQVRVENLVGPEIPHLFVFENRPGKISFAMHKNLTGGAALAPAPSNLAAVLREVEAALVSNGLYTKEARAMIETWRDTWFEEGLRVFYVLPRREVDARLPLMIEPAPEQVERVFVGRVEVLDRDTRDEIRLAVATNDQKVLSKYGRFLAPFLTQMSSGAEAGNGRGRLHVARASARRCQ